MYHQFHFFHEDDVKICNIFALLAEGTGGHIPSSSGSFLFFFSSLQWHCQHCLTFHIMCACWIGTLTGASLPLSARKQPPKSHKHLPSSPLFPDLPFPFVSSVFPPQLLSILHAKKLAREFGKQCNLPIVVRRGTQRQARTATG